MLTALTILAFVLGYFIHLFLKVDEAVRSKNNPADSRWVLIKQNAAVLLARFFFASIVFWVVRSHPELLTTLAGYIGLGSYLGAQSGQLTLVTNIPLAAIFGYEADSLLAYIPVLQNQVPQFPTPPAAAAK